MPHSAIADRWVDSKLDHRTEVVQGAGSRRIEAGEEELEELEVLAWRNELVLMPILSATIKGEEEG